MRNVGASSSGGYLVSGSHTVALPQKTLAPIASSRCKPKDPRPRQRLYWFRSQQRSIQQSTSTRVRLQEQMAHQGPIFLSTATEPGPLGDQRPSAFDSLT